MKKAIGKWALGALVVILGYALVAAIVSRGGSEPKAPNLQGLPALEAGQIELSGIPTVSSDGRGKILVQYGPGFSVLTLAPSVSSVDPSAVEVQGYSAGIKPVEQTWVISASPNGGAETVDYRVSTMPKGMVEWSFALVGANTDIGGDIDVATMSPFTVWMGSVTPSNEQGNSLFGGLAALGLLFVAAAGVGIYVWWSRRSRRENQTETATPKRTEARREMPKNRPAPAATPTVTAAPAATPAVAAPVTSTTAERLFPTLGGTQLLTTMGESWEEKPSRPPEDWTWGDEDATAEPVEEIPPAQPKAAPTA